MGLAISSKRNTFDPDAYPADIWALILDFVADGPNRTPRDFDPSYRPFQAIPMRERDWEASVAQARSLSTLYQLVLVCKRWHVWLSPRLYSCLRIHHGTHALLEGLVRRRNRCLAAAASRSVDGDDDADGVIVEEDAFQVDYASFVRAIQVHHDPVDFDPFNPLPLCDIITLCAPTIEYFARPCLSRSGGALLQLPKISKTQPLGASKDNLGSHVPYPFPTLPNLRRIDWYNSGAIKNQLDIPSFLAALLVASSHAKGGLQTLAYYHEEITIHPPWNATGVVVIPAHTSLSLKTLRLENESDTLRLFTLDLPNLENLIISKPHHTHATNLTITKAGKRVKRLEVTQYPYLGINVSPADVETIWRALPNLEEISLSIRAVMTFAEMHDSSPRRGPGIRWEKVRILRLQCGDIGVCLTMEMVMSGRMPGPLLVAFLKDKLNPAVFESVVLYGPEAEWRTDSDMCLSELDAFIKTLPNVTLEFAG